MEKKGDNSFGVASLVLGIVSVVLSPTIIFSSVLGIVGLIFGFIQRKDSKNKWSIWGIVLSIIGILVSLVILIAIIKIIGGVNETIARCVANPSLPGCEDLAELYGISQ